MTQSNKKNTFTKKIQNLIHKKNYLEKNDLNSNSNHKKKGLRTSKIEKTKNNLVPLNLPSINLNQNVINEKTILAESESFTSSIEIENSMINRINDINNDYDYQSTEKYGYSNLNQKNKKIKSDNREEKKCVYKLGIENLSSFEHVIINEIEPIKQISLQSNLNEDYSYLSMNIEKLQVFLKKIKSNYVETYESYGSMVEGYNNLIKNINILYKRVENQTNKINKINNSLSRLNNNNIWLKNQHNTFLLYKKEINKYIEVFKESLHNKTEEIKNLYEENNKITQKNIKYECENDLLKRDCENILIRTQKLMNDKEIIIEDLASVRRRINELEKKTRDKYYDMMNEITRKYDNKIIRYEKCLYEIKDIIFIHRDYINKLKSNIYLVQERTIDILIMNEKRCNEIFKSKEKIKIIEEERINEKRFNELKNEINNNSVNKLQEFLKYCKIKGYDIITVNLKKLLKIVNELVIHGKEFSKRDTGEFIIEYYTTLIKKQNQIFKNKEEEYKIIIKNLESKNQIFKNKEEEYKIIIKNLESKNQIFKNKEEEYKIIIKDLESKNQIFKNKEEEYKIIIKNLESKKKSTSEESNVWDIFD